MALPHAQPLDVIDIRPLGQQLAASVSTSLLKTEHLHLMRLVLQAGQSLPEHRVPGGITIQCLEGAADVITPSRSSALTGELVMLPGGEAYAVTARQHSSLLITMLLQQ